MSFLTRRDFLHTSLATAGALALGEKTLRADIAPGVETIAAPLISGEERNAQGDLWALEVRYKPVRMIRVDLADSKTGKTSKELVWYLAYRTLVRPNSRVPDTTENPEDRPIFVPELTFATDDEGKMKTYPDRVLPAAQAAIIKRERHPYKNSVQIVAPLPAVTPDNAKKFISLDGVAMWTGIDPDTDFFTVYFTGFSNGYKVDKGPNGEEIVLRRTLMQKFWRPSDRFDQHEEEIRLKDEPKWVYR